MSTSPKERAKAWRDRQREAAELDAAIVAAVMRATGGRRDHAGRLRTRDAEVRVVDVVGHAAYALGGKAGFVAAKVRILGRLGEAVDSQP